MPRSRRASRTRTSGRGPTAETLTRLKIEKLHVKEEMERLRAQTE